MAHNNEAATGLPQITIEIPDGDSNSTTNNTPPPSTESPETAISPCNLSAAPVGGYRDRAMSGSTLGPQSPHLAPPKSAGGTSISSGASLFSYEEQQDALKPDPGAEADFQIDNNSFAFSPGHLNKLLNPKSLPAYVALGGLAGIERGLRTDRTAGLSIDETTLAGSVSFEEATKASEKAWELEKSGNPGSNATGTATAAAGTAHTPASADSNAFADRIRVFKRNVLPAKKPTPLWKLMWLAYNDKVLILLTVAAAISLALGLYETFGVDHPPGSPMPVDWIEGCAICIAIIIVVLVGALNDYQKERAFVRLNTKKEDREVKVIRSGKSFMISVHDLLVGDVVHLEPGDLIPADGVFITGHNVKCDESSATGESDQMKKTGGDQVMRLLEQGHAKHQDLDPFIISGSKVLEGVGTYLVTSVGVNSSYGKILMAMRQDPEPTPLQVKLDGLAGAIAKLGSSAAAFLFFVLLFRFLGTLPGSELTANEKASKFMDILIVAITVIVVAVPEGLPLAVTLALAFATTRLVKLNNLVRILKSCETMGNATTVCSDKTGTLTQNKMTVVTGTFGEDAFDDKNQRGDERRSTAFARDMSAENKRTLIESIAINSTAFEGEEAGEAGFVGSKTETALLGFARNVLGMGSLSEERANAQVVQLMPFDSGRKCMGAVQKLPNGSYRFLVKGASEILLGYSSSLLTASGEVPLDQERRERFEAIINNYAEQSLRTIALITKDFPQWPPAGTAAEEDPSIANVDLLLKDMTLLGVVGIQDPIRPGVPQAVAKCQHAGVCVRMVTGDNVVTAKAIATDCGIYTDGIVMEGPVFRTLTHEKMVEILPRLQVLARSSPEDKRILVTKLRSMGDIVAVTGDGTNDGPALKAADIGFSMGIAGTEVAKEASAIILMDDNFASILTALMWGRAVNDAVRKFLQFQLTVNITAVILTFVSSVSDSEMRSVLTAVQLLWINLIMDSLAALALATDPPTEEILNRKPPPRTAPLISIVMWKMIIGQALFQLGVTLILHFGGPRFLDYPDAELRSVVFNCFVWMQIFNMYNNRRLDNRFNIFAGVHRNYFFILINCIMIGCQIAIAFIGGKAFSIVRINGAQWAISIVVAALCLPWAVLVRIFPDAWFEVSAKFVGKPVVLVYRPLSRASSRLGHAIKRLFGRGKKKADEGENAAETESDSDAAVAVPGGNVDPEKGGAAAK
ncbi:Calcium-translocating P-type ATPAse [Lasiodiplodia theobromae]|uniref:Calcium-translocating P-type ATPAse n=1 Tax=Lasiodiplodia theobromae TaxID=45133 RepID=UPI0015C2E1C1|nr:Calcium-translocating P-type ATPAse [Lasiodiplodia theobromae]KAF4538867.1 Calcium-translocating P-type ATPAse [Lasiodiplodia theobromae]